MASYFERRKKPPLPRYSTRPLFQTVLILSLSLLDPYGLSRPVEAAASVVVSRVATAARRNAVPFLPPRESGL